VVARDRSLLAEFLVDALFKYFIVHRRYTAQTLNFRARYLLAAELYFFSLVLYSSDLIHSTLTKKMNTVLRHKIRERERAVTLVLKILNLTLGGFANTGSRWLRQFCTDSGIGLHDAQAAFDIGAFASD
jgi:hypothetical protein